MRMLESALIHVAGGTYQVCLQDACGGFLVDSEIPLTWWLLDRLDLAEVLLDSLELRVDRMVLRVRPLQTQRCCRIINDCY